MFSMLIIKLFRVGKKNQPFFKIVVTDRRRPTRAGRFVEELGNYNPLTKEKVLKAERIKYWLSVGAKPSASIFNLLIKEKIIEGKKIPVHKKAKAKESAEVPSAPVAAAAPDTIKKEAAAQGEKPELVPEKPAEKPAEEKPSEKPEEEEKTKEEEKPKEEKKEDLSSETPEKPESLKTE